MDWFNIILLLLLLPLVLNRLQALLLYIRYRGLCAELEEKRGSKVISLIHKDQKPQFFKMQQSRMIDLDDASAILDELRSVPADTPIDLILHTKGGYMIAAEQIAHALLGHVGKVTAFVPYYALSGGTLVALAADEIVMDDMAVLGRVDPQLWLFPAYSLKKAVDAKGAKEVSDTLLIAGDMATNVLRRAQEGALKILRTKGYPEPVAQAIVQELISSEHTHDTPVMYEDAKQWGLRVATEMPPEVYAVVRSTSGLRV